MIAEAPSDTSRPAVFPSPLCDMSHTFLTPEEACNAAHLHCSRATLTRYLSKYGPGILWRNDEARHRLIHHARLHEFMDTIMVGLPLESMLPQLPPGLGKRPRRRRPPTS